MVWTLYCCDQNIVVNSNITWEPNFEPMFAQFDQIGGGTMGYDCILIPGAKVGADLADMTANAINASMFCGQSKGLGSKKDGDAAKTICSMIEL